MSDAEIPPRFVRFEQAFVDLLDRFEPAPPDVAMRFERAAAARRAGLTAANAVRDPGFLGAVWEAAAASRPEALSRMPSFGAFADGLAALAEDVASLDRVRLEDATPEQLARAAGLVRRIPLPSWAAQGLVLHHVLPDLVPPLGLHTLAVFGRDAADPRDPAVVLRAFEDLAALARRTGPGRHVGRNPFCTSATKVLDVALQAFVASGEMDGVRAGEESLKN